MGRHGGLLIGSAVCAANPPDESMTVRWGDSTEQSSNWQQFRCQSSYGQFAWGKLMFINQILEHTNWKIGFKSPKK
jgi:hypothetical protein